MTGPTNDLLITGMDVREYFRDSITTAVSRQNLEINTETILYVVNMLTTFIRSENLYEKTDDGYMIKALALIYAESLDADTATEKNRIL
ncbi:MAG TPA: hypothetical protein VJ981_02800, partial [Gammaproteobacteria bacterium]|nr:hypothetical protein [Gammaproteobacteria bacterium]